jgi:hypothetical protein
MGRCVITIHVTGSHHNKASRDIDQMAAEFVQELSKFHTVTEAYMGSNAQELKSTEVLFPKEANSGSLDGHVA